MARHTMVFAALALSFCRFAVAQQPTYLITAIAGGSQPATAAPGTSVMAPAARVATDPAGNVYFCARAWNTVFKLDTNGMVTRIAGNGYQGYAGDGGAATTAELSYPSGVAADGSGNVYIADSHNSRVRKVDTNGIITTVAGNGRFEYTGDGGLATSAGSNDPWALAIDASGNLYIAELNNNVVRKVASNGIISTVAGTGTAGFSGDGSAATSAQLNGMQGVATDGSGNLYIADSGNNRIRKVAPNGVITTVAGNGTAGYSGDGAPAIGAQLSRGVYDVVVDGSGNLYINDHLNVRIRKVAPNGIITTVAGNGTSGFAGDGGQAINAQVEGSVAVDPSGNLYIASGSYGRIRKVSATGIIRTVAGGLIGDGNLAVFAPVYGGGQMVKDNAGNLYIADTGLQCVRKIAANGMITTVAGNGTAGYSGDGGPAPSAQLNNPNGVAVDAAGNVYIADTDNHRVRKVNANGTITTVAGTGSRGFAGDLSPAIGAQLNSPAGLAADASGNLYVADTVNNRIRKVAAASGIITTVAGSGAATFSGDSGPAITARLNAPTGLALDTAGNVYIADSGNNRIRKVAATNGVITTVAGTGTAGFSGDGGAGTGAQLNGPWGVAVDSSTNLYFTDLNNARVRMVTSSGTITTVAGRSNKGFTGDGGLATNAELQAPSGLAADNAGSLYVSDSGNYAIRLLTPVGTRAVLTVLAIHSGNFTAGQSGTYTITVTNAAGAGPSSGTVTVTDLVPASFTLTSLTGPGWDCSGNTCTRSDGLNGSANYPPITATVDVSAAAPAQVTTQVSVSGGGAATTGSGDLVLIIQPPLTISSVRNAASLLSGPVAPGEIVTIGGTSLGPVQTARFQVSGGVLSTTLGGTQVLFDGTPAALISVQANQIGAIVPYEVAGAASTQLQVAVNGNVTNAISIPVAEVAPAIFTQDASGTGPGMILNADGSPNSPTNPAGVGTVVTIAATGEGLTSPPGVDGLVAADSPPAPVQGVSVQIGPATDAQVVYAGGAAGLSAGFFQVMVTIPADAPLGDGIPILINVGGASSQAGVTLSIK